MSVNSDRSGSATCVAPHHELLARIGHGRVTQTRTKDIDLDENVTFSDLGLPNVIVNGLYNSGFETPSPIQLSAIPVGRCGLDLVVQAKSGTGKTCVFTVIALEAIDLNITRPQVLVLAPTREIALQIHQVMLAIGSSLKNLECHCSIGGLSYKEDKKKVNLAHIVIGTPGRIQHLIRSSALDCCSIRLMVLDEADKLLECEFQEQINWIYSGLPDSKQVIAASATYTEQLVTLLCNYMHNPTFVRLNASDPVLLGVTQYKRFVSIGDFPNEGYNNKVNALIGILSATNFQQCLVFSNLMSRAENLSKLLVSKGWPATHIAGCLEQSERMDAITKLKTYDCRILISTDLTARGIDANRIDLVINLDLPYDTETYLHRVGRAGRYGAKGAAVTLFTEREAEKLEGISNQIKTTIHDLPDILSADFIQNPQISAEKVKRIIQVESFQIMTEDIKGMNKSDHVIASSKKSKNTKKSKGHRSDQVSSWKKCKQKEQVNKEQNQPSATTEDTAKGQPTAVAGTTAILKVKEHRPPFSSLGDALKFLEDPHTWRTMLDTTKYCADLKTVNIKSDENGCVAEVKSINVGVYGGEESSDEDEEECLLNREQSADVDEGRELHRAESEELLHRPPHSSQANVSIDGMELKDLHSYLPQYRDNQGQHNSDRTLKKSKPPKTRPNSSKGQGQNYLTSSGEEKQSHTKKDRLYSAAETFASHYQKALYQHFYITQMARSCNY